MQLPVNETAALRLPRPVRVFISELRDYESLAQLRVFVLILAIVAVLYAASDGSSESTGDLLTYALAVWLAAVALFWRPTGSSRLKRWDR